MKLSVGGRSGWWKDRKLELPSVPLGFMTDSLAALSIGSCLLVTFTLFKDTYLFLVALCPCGAHQLFSSCSPQASHCSGFSCCRAQALGAWASVAVAPGFSSTGSVVVVCGLSHPAARGIFPDQGLNSCLLHWQADS